MDKMQKTYEEEISKPRAKNEIIQQEKDNKGLVWSTLTLPEPTKQPWEESKQMAQTNNFVASNDYGHSIVTVNTTGLLSFVVGITKVSLSSNWTMPMFDNNDCSTDSDEQI